MAESVKTEKPLFRLNSVIREKSGEKKDFEGPLDVILFLLGKNRLEIQDISIAAILDQYLEWIHAREELDLDIASEFILMASRLLAMKTRMMLALEDEQAKSEMDDLVQSLEKRRRSVEYGKIAAAAKTLAPMGEFGRNVVFRAPEVEQKGPVYEYHQEPQDLLRAMAALRERARRSLPPPRSAFRHIVQREPFPVERKSGEILTLLLSGPAPLQALFASSQSRSEIVATFLAVLELCHTSSIYLMENEDGSWTVERTGKETTGRKKTETGKQKNRQK